MDDLADLYRRKLNLPNAVFTYIDHEDAMVAAVFKILQLGSSDLILKVCFGEWPSDCKSSFLEGYASIRRVPDYKSVMPLLRLSRGIAAVGFTVKRGTWESKNSKLYQFNLRYLKSLTDKREA